MFLDEACDGKECQSLLVMQTKVFRVSQSQAAGEAPCSQKGHARALNIPVCQRREKAKGASEVWGHNVCYFQLLSCQRDTRLPPAPLHGCMAFDGSKAAATKLRWRLLIARG